MVIDAVKTLDNVRIRRTGHWIVDPNEKFAGGNMRVGIKAGAQMIVSLVGSSIRFHVFKGEGFGSFDVKLNTKNCSLSAIVRGEELDLSKHRYGMEIKAVTYHMLEIHDMDPFFVKVLFDI